LVDWQPRGIAQEHFHRWRHLAPLIRIVSIAAIRDKPFQKHLVSLTEDLSHGTTFSTNLVNPIGSLPIATSSGASSIISVKSPISSPSKTLCDQFFGL
jgi:hypothetical protein